MKIVPFSNTLILTANSNSDFFGATHCILSFDKKELEVLKRYCEAANTMKALDEKFYCLEKWFEAAAWINNEEIELEEGKDFAYIEITQNEIHELPDFPESLVEGVLKIHPGNLVCVSCFADSDRSEFWSNEFDLTELFNQ